MIFYFSGTGNSLDIAKDIAKNQNEQLVSIAKEMNSGKEIYEYELGENEKIIFIYPIYAWAPPKMVLDFVSKLKISNYNKNYISTIACCGENIGNAVSLLKNKLDDKGLILNSGFSVTMPNNYIIMGTVDSDDKEKLKLDNAKSLLVEINNTIKNSKNDIYKLEKGFAPRVRTYLLGGLFNKFPMKTEQFIVNDECIGCGICESVCNNNCIKIDKKPLWSGECSQCLACISYCPKKAINYGKGTVNKKRYKNPSISVKDMEK